MLALLSYVSVTRKHYWKNDSLLHPKDNKVHTTSPLWLIVPNFSINERKIVHGQMCNHRNAKGHDFILTI